MIVIDPDIRGLTGLETILQVRNRPPNVGFIALTILNGKVYRQVAIAVGAEDLVRKGA